MKRPWQIWTIFFVVLMIVVPPMIWLSVKAIEVDRQRENDRIQTDLARQRAVEQEKETELARQQAELQERVSSALYRLDLKLLPLVAQEAARPYYLYDAFYDSPAKGFQQLSQQTNTPPLGKPGSSKSTKGKQQTESPQSPEPNFAGKVPSPLMFDLPEFVKLHFQIDDSGNVQSPQLPTGDAREVAITCGFQPLTGKAIGIAEVKGAFDYTSVNFQCAPVASWEPQSIAQRGIPDEKQNGAQKLLQSMSESNVFNSPAVNKVAQNINSQNYQVAVPEPQGEGNNKYSQQILTNTNRVNQEFNQRQESTRTFADKQWLAANSDKQIAYGNSLYREYQNRGQTKKESVALGAMQPMWIDKNLIMARRVALNGQSRVQVCWLDWPAIEKALSAEVNDLLPNVEFQPIDENSNLHVGSALTTIPVRLVTNTTATLATPTSISTSRPPLANGFSGLSISLLVAWIGLGIATLATALLLNGVIQMSERRATFVSAVTHELRTPLTTFRMYAEMLAEKMVPEDKTQQYANTLRVQADRLSHLVENVLQFARLERGNHGGAMESLIVGDLLDRFHERLTERVEQEGMTLKLDIANDVLKSEINTQPAQIEQVLFNLIDNASKYAKPSSDNRIILSVVSTTDAIEFRVQDHGPGVESKYRKRMFQPFCKSDQDAANTAPGVGLGLSLCQRMAKSLGGKLYLADSENGACFVLKLPR